MEAMSSGRHAAGSYDLALASGATIRGDFAGDFCSAVAAHVRGSLLSGALDVRPARGDVHLRRRVRELDLHAGGDRKPVDVPVRPHRRLDDDVHAAGGACPARPVLAAVRHMLPDVPVSDPRLPLSSVPRARGSVTMRTPPLLRWSYAVGAAIDGLMVVVMLLPPRWGGRMLGLEAFSPGPDYRYAMALAAALMAGWTALLVWAARSPVERRAILLLTVLVVVGLMAANLYAVASGFVAFAGVAPTLAMQLGLCVLFVLGYRAGGPAP